MFKLVATGAVVFVSLILILLSAVTIDETERGVHTRFGVVTGMLEPGFHIVNPFTSRVDVMRVSTQKVEVEENAASNDLQDVTAVVAVQYALDSNNVEQIYKEYRNELQLTVINPAIQESIKAGAAKFTAEELVTKRAEVKDEIEKVLRDRLAEAYVRVSNVDIIDFRFSDSFNRAIEEKVTAEQNAAREENRLAQVEFEAQQRITQAQAEAEAIRIQAEAITQQGGDNYVQLQAIEKWNGNLPQQFVPGSAVPFINL
jgi:regulator of protease activity HflC (stomatin/prohibitin superfamily)